MSSEADKPVTGRRGRTTGIDGVAPRAVGAGAGGPARRSSAGSEDRLFVRSRRGRRRYPGRWEDPAAGDPEHRDQVVQSAVKLVLEPIFEADLCRVPPASARNTERRTRSPRSTTSRDQTENASACSRPTSRRATTRVRLRLPARWLARGSSLVRSFTGALGHARLGHCHPRSCRYVFLA